MFKKTEYFCTQVQENIQMDSKKEVTHTGIVKAIEEKRIIVSVVVKSGCASCEIKGACNMSEQADKELTIECNTSEYRIGQKVVVHLKSAQGMHAVFYGYVLPFIVLLTTMIITSMKTENEGLIGAVALGSLVPYYFALYLNRNTFKKKFTYVVKPLTNKKL